VSGLCSLGTSEVRDRIGNKDEVPTTAFATGSDRDVLSTCGTSPVFGIAVPPERIALVADPPVVLTYWSCHDNHLLSRFFEFDRMLPYA
jgi:hypothetical protein